MRTLRRKLIRQRILPASYERLNYIENTSTAYINCGLQPKYTFDYELKANVKTGNVFLGYKYAGDSADYRFFFKNTFYFDVGHQRISVYTGAILDSLPFYHVKFGNYYINSIYPKGYDVTGDTFNETMNETKINNLFLFWDGYKSFTNNYSVGKIYFLKIKDKDKFIRYFIPAKRKSDGVIGMYDLVGRKFYTSPNGVAFTGG